MHASPVSIVYWADALAARNANSMSRRPSLIAMLRHWRQQFINVSDTEENVVGIWEDKK